MSPGEHTAEDTPLLASGVARRGHGRTSSDQRATLVPVQGSKNGSGAKKDKLGVDISSIYALESLAILTSYFSIGVALQLLSTPLAYYLIGTLGASSSTYMTYLVLTTLPWSFKVLYGFLSDSVPIYGLKRKPYFVIGWLIHIVCFTCLAIVGNPGVQLTISLAFIAACGYLLSDVMTDAMVVERTKLEAPEHQGSMQATGYIARYFGAMVGATVGAVTFNKNEWGWGLEISELFWLNALTPLVTILPFLPYLHEERQLPGQQEAGISTLRGKVASVWGLVQKRAVWRPMTFVYLYNALMVPNGAWTNYLVESLEFSNFELGVVSIVAQVFSWLGLIIYKTWMSEMNWRSIYVITSFAGLMLLFGVNRELGLPDIAFAIGDEAAIDLFMALQFLPLTRMYAVMCPDGSEGTSYALLTTMSNVAYSVAYSIGDLLAGMGGSWDVSNETLAAGDVSGMWRVTLLTSSIQLMPLVLIGLLPASLHEQKLWQQSSEGSKVGGAIFVAVAVVSVVFSFSQGMWELFSAS